MDILNPCSEMLTNRDVLDILNSDSNGCKKLTNLATITYETITYLEGTPAKITTPNSITQFEKAISSIGVELSRIELVQLANLCPENETELCIIVDNAEERFSDDQRSNTINLIRDMKVFQNLDQSIDDVIPRKKPRN